jgi:hypothetical protein
MFRNTRSDPTRVSRGLDVILAEDLLKFDYGELGI